jgi:hypothetical protein
VKVPVAVEPLATAKLTVPAGVEAVPMLPGPSTTVALQEDIPPTVTVAGEQDTVVVVGRRLTVMRKAVTDELPA